MDGWNVISRTSCNFHRVAPLVFTKIFELQKNFQKWFPCKQTDEIIKFSRWKFQILSQVIGSPDARYSFRMLYKKTCVLLKRLHVRGVSLRLPSLDLVKKISLNHDDCAPIRQVISFL